MAVAIISRFPEGAGAEQYDAVTKEMGFADQPPEGLLFHSAGELKGRFHVFNVWETPENFEEFVKDRLRPAQVAIMGEERVAALPDAEIIHVPIHKYLIP
ncbi:MAG: hypothetical protein LC740_08695 [Actinobacteria bacterium]|nr:hypothetical protein [Actinomycetota bacterium]